MMKVQRLVALTTLLMMMITSTACSDQGKKAASGESFFSNLSDYEATVTVSFLKDSQPNQLSMKQTASMEGRYEMVYLSPKHLEGTKVCFDGEKMIEVYPDKEMQIEQKVGAAENEILLTSFAKRFLTGASVKKQEETLNGKKMITYEMPIPGQYKYLSKEKIWLDKESLSPVQLEIYDTEGKVSIQVMYEDFKYNL